MLSRHSLQAFALTLLAAAPASVVGVSEKAFDLMDALRCSDGQFCGPAAVNCSFDNARGGTVVEVTDQSNNTNYASITPNVTPEDLPSPLPEPYILVADNTFAPANNGTCFSRSPGVPVSCGDPGSDECLTKPTFFDIEWLAFGTLVCTGSSPKGVASSLEDIVPPPGTVNVIATKQCKDYKYTPPWMASVTDPWGSKWALQTSQREMPDDAAWKANLDAVVWPDGWTWENITLTGM